MNLDRLDDDQLRALRDGRASEILQERRRRERERERQEEAREAERRVREWVRGLRFDVLEDLASLSRESGPERPANSTDRVEIVRRADPPYSAVSKPEAIAMAAEELRRRKRERSMRADGGEPAGFQVVEQNQDTVEQILRNLGLGDPTTRAALLYGGSALALLWIFSGSSENAEADGVATDGGTVAAAGSGSSPTPAPAAPDDGAGDAPSPDAPQSEKARWFARREGYDLDDRQTFMSDCLSAGSRYSGNMSACAHLWSLAEGGG